MRYHSCAALCVLVCALGLSSVAQVSTGVPPFSSTSASVDVINVGNLNVHLSVPVLSKAGRGLPFNYQLNYDNSVWYPLSGFWEPVANWGWTAPGNGITGGIQIFTTQRHCIDPDTGLVVFYYMHRFANYYDAFGTKHAIVGAFFQDDSICGPSSSSNGNTTDGSGYTIQPFDASDANVLDRSGKTIDVATSGTVQDNNGNQITATGNNFYDTTSSSSPVLAATGAAPNPLVYTYKDTSGTARTVTITYTAYTVQTNFQCSGIQDYPAHANTYLVDRITYPNTSYYKFTYEPTPGIAGAVTGRIASVQLPAGGTITYAYAGGNNGIRCEDGSNAGVTRTTSDGSWTYSRTLVGGSEWSTTVQYPNSTGTATVYFQNSGGNYYETKRTVVQGTSTLQSTNTCYNGSIGDCTGTTINLPISEINAITQLDSGPQARTDTFYNSSTGLPTEVDTYDFGSGGPGGLLSKTLTSYQSFSDNPNILDHPYQITVQDGAGHQQSQTTYNYDQTAVTATGDPQHVAVSVSRGNPTTITQWLSTGTNPDTIYAYDDAGNVLTAKDARGNTSTFQYGACAGAFLTQITRPATVNGNHISSATYDCNTGLALTTNDENNRQSTYNYDAMLRPVSSSYPDGGSTTNVYTPYNPTNGARASVETKKKLDTAGSVIDQTSYFGGIGRQTSSVLVDPEGNDTVATTYDSNGRVYSVSNPSRATSTSTDGTSYYSYDALNRVTNVTEQDGATVQTAYAGNVTTVTDEAGRVRQTTVDGLGRLTKVVEPNPSSNSLTSGQFTTTYSYIVNTDGTNTLQIVQSGDGSQSARTRTLTYDSLSRLTSSSAPESGLTSYQYDQNGNNTQITDARNVSTTIGYDALNRPTSKIYSDGTPSVSFNYDEASPWGIVGNNNTVGRLSSTAVSGNLSGSIYIYDSMGRLIRNDQCAKSICGTTSYPVYASYDLTGDLASITYPSGRLVTNSYNTAGRLTAVNYASYNGTSVNYPYYTVPQSTGSSSWGYFPTGAVTRFTFGPGTSETLSSNNRYMTNQITASTSAQTLLSKTYGFMSPNNGNITQITDNLNGGKTVAFGYDYLNRLTSASSSDSSWSQSFSIDPWGNLKQSGTSAFVPNFGTDNRMAPNQGYIYDSDGNLLNDTFHTYTYDAEERMTTVDSTVGVYTYSADGTRSRKDISGDYTEYVYFGGQPIAEKNSAGDWTDYIFANGQRIAKAEGLNRDLHIYGTLSGASQWAVFNFANAAGLNGYTIRSGDTLFLAQYQPTGSKGGLTLSFADGTNSNWTVTDKEGYYLNDDHAQDTTHFRTIDLSSLAGKVINNVLANQEVDSVVGTWNVYYDYISLVSTDGTVQPIYTGQTASTLSVGLHTSGETGLGSTIDTNRDKATSVEDATTYYVSDHLGSSRMILSGFGYPVWSGVFLPYGQELNPQITMNKFKFTGLERDSESNLDHTSFRQYETFGRWLSPDPYLGSMDLTNPQSLNRYAYVTNNPLSLVDRNGLDPFLYDVPTDTCGGDTFLACEDARNSGGGGGPGGSGGCYLMGMLTPCSVVSSAIGAGAAVQCPGNLCSGTNAAGYPVDFQAFNGGGAGYYTPHGAPGSVYYNSDAAASGAKSLYGSDSVDQKREFSGAIYEDDNGVFSFTPAELGDPCTPFTGCSSPYVPAPDGTHFIAGYHSHPFDTGADQFFGDHYSTIEYIFAPSGSLSNGGVAVFVPHSQDWNNFVFGNAAAPVCMMTGSVPNVRNCH